GVGDYGMVGIALDGRLKGDATESAIRWREQRAYPNVPSPLHFDGILFSVRNGGILSTHAASTGKLLRTGRTMEGLGDYYSS
ncbi:MAG: hypothetical protein JNL62_30540, partial [Bryobacterales bacterium]|nr:hypothetical protein [Bryobacterales bacterium]